MMFQDQVLKKVIWGQNSRRKFMNSEHPWILVCNEFHVKHSIPKFWDQMWPNKIFSGRNSRKELSNFESLPLIRLCTKFNLRQSTFKIRDQIYPNMFLTECKKNVECRISIPKNLHVPSFIYSKKLWSVGTQSTTER